MVTRPATALQAPTALLALVQHIHTHGLGAPLTITAPTMESPHFLVTVVSGALDAWIASGVTDLVQVVEPHRGSISGRPWERVQVDGLLQPYGIRVRLVAVRPLPVLTSVVPA